MPSIGAKLQGFWSGMAMQVSNEEDFEAVFTLVEHPHFGPVFEANAIAIKNGNMTLRHQRIRMQNSSYFRLTESEKQALALIEECEPEEIIKKFVKAKKVVKPPEFYKNYYTPDLHQNHVRPYIEKRILKIIELIRYQKTYLPDAINNPAGHQLEISDEQASVLFHFRRNEEGTNYFITIKHNEQKLVLDPESCKLIVSNPAWALIQNKLISFQKNLEGKKLLPFFKKKFIHIPPNAENEYFKKFVVPLVEKHDVYAQGFEIETEQHQATPIIKFYALANNQAFISLNFRYGNWVFPFNITKQVNVTLDKKNDSYLFRRLRRSRNIEESKKLYLEENGLTAAQGSLFTLGDHTNGVELPLLINWVNTQLDSLQEQGFEVDQQDLKNTYFIGTPFLKMNVSDKIDWFDINATVKFGDFEIPFHHLRRYILKGQREVVLPDKTIAVIPEEWMQRLSPLFRFMHEDEDEKLQLKKIHYTLLDELADMQGEGEQNKEKFDQVPKLNSNELIPSPSRLKADLRPYQLVGFNWMKKMGDNHFGVCLADDMGLGKTLQTIALISELGDTKNRTPEDSLPMNEAGKSSVSSESKIKPILIVVPTSLLFNWESELKKFAPHLVPFIYSGTNRQKIAGKIAKSKLIITTYGILRKDIDLLEKTDYEMVVLDESQAIKNPFSVTSQVLQRIKASRKITLTGTPIENSILDIWSQMQFLNPGLLGNYRYFKENYIKPIEKNQNLKKQNELKKLISPFILRRTKQEVAPELPEKIEKMVLCEMSTEQEEFYEKTKSQYRNEILNSINEVGLNKSRMKILAGLVKLRQIANHPSMVDEDYEGSSGKMDEIMRNMQNALDAGHKILVFSQFVKHLNLFRNALDGLHIEYAYLDGSTPSAERAQEVARFQDDQNIRVFLISLKAGGTGLNLTSADYVFLLDPWWNPAVERQAQDRTHRIGQNQTVFAYKFIAKNTIEEKIVLLQERKKALADNIIGNVENLISNLTEEELVEILS